MKKLILKKTCVVLQSSAVMKERNAALLLLLTSFIWGLSFVAQSVSSDLVGPFTFNSIRLLIGGIVLVPFAIPSIRKGMHDPGYWKNTLKAGIVCGLLLAAASVTQQIGVGYSGAGKGGFITSVYIIIVPFISLIFGKKVEKKTWIAGLVALIGMYLLCMGGENTISVGDDLPWNDCRRSCHLDSAFGMDADSLCRRILLRYCLHPSGCRPEICAAVTCGSAALA